MAGFSFTTHNFLACCGSKSFAEEMVNASPFSSAEEAISTARFIWFNKVNVMDWLEAFSSHPQIGESPPSEEQIGASTQWSKIEQSTAQETATCSTRQELADWNVQYRQKFGFIFLICASGRSTSEILSELRKRFSNRPMDELEVAGKEQMMIVELRLRRLFPSVTDRGDVLGRVLSVGAHLVAVGPRSVRTRPPITTHVLDVGSGHPAAGVEVVLEVLRGSSRFGDWGRWVRLGSSVTDADGRSTDLVEVTEEIDPGIYRISFNTGKYCGYGFYPFVSIGFEIKRSQSTEHFHVPLLLSPFSFTTYRGS